MNQPPTDELEAEILEVIEEWRNGAEVNAAILGPIQALARLLIFADDLYAQSEGLDDESQLFHLSEVLRQEQAHVREHATTEIKYPPTAVN